jgi:outer membrane protein assembly factor BamB
MPGMAIIAAVILSGCTGASAVLGASWPGLSVSQNTIYLSYGKVYALNHDGTPLWSFPAPPNQLAANQAFFAPPAVSDHLVVVTDYTDSMFGINPADGTQKWMFKYKSPSSGSRFIGGPILGDKLIYAATVDGVVHAIPTDNQSGAAQEAWSYATDGNIWATPLLDSGTLYVTSLDGHVYALDAGTGKLQWKFPDETSAPENPPMRGIVGTPTLHNGVLYFGSLNNRLYALDTNTRKVLWRYDTTNWVWSSPVIDDNTGYLVGADLDGHIFAIDPAKSTADKVAVVWPVDTTTLVVNGTIVGAPLLETMDDGTRVAYITTGGDPNLLVLNAKNGSVIRSKTITNTTQTSFLIIPTGPNTRTVKLYPAPVLTRDSRDATLLLASHEGDNVIYALNGKTLAEQWTLSLKDADAKLVAKTQPTTDPQTGLFSGPVNTFLLIISVFLLISLVLRSPKGGKK